MDGALERRGSNEIGVRRNTTGDTPMTGSTEADGTAPRGRSSMGRIATSSVRKHARRDASVNVTRHSLCDAQTFLKRRKTGALLYPL